MNPEDYTKVRAWTEMLAAPLTPEDQTVQSMPDVSPTKWHRAHTTWFFETFVLSAFVPGWMPYDEQYGYLFNSYYETVGAPYPRHQRGLISRPGVDDIASYRRAVDAVMVDLLRSCPAPDVEALVELGLHHEQQHQELLLMDIKHVLSVNPTRPSYQPTVSLRTAAATQSSWKTHAGGIVQIGNCAGEFCFDNETPVHQVLLQPFEISDRLVTCGEWLAFIDDGGYRRPELWMSEGWALVTSQAWEAPLYWERSGERWSAFTLSGLRPLDPDEPVVHVSWFEADAYARWAGGRLPLEAEVETVAPPPPPPGAWPAALHPSPPTAADAEQWYGQAWQWTASSYNPYPGFRPAPGAVGEYNGKFMISQQVLRGSSFATPPGHARRSYRNFFPPAARWPFAGVRVARDAA